MGDTGGMSVEDRAAFRRGGPSGLVEGDRPANRLSVRWSHAGFVAAALLPTVWLLRRLPIGFFYMFGFWTAVGSAVLIVAVTATKPRQPSLARAIPFLAAGVPLGLLLLAMIPLARADARGQDLPLTDTQVAALAIGLQAALAIWAAHRTHQAGERLVGLVVTYAAVLVTMTVRLTVGRNLSAWWFVPVVAVIAVQIAALPGQPALRPDGDPGNARTLRMTCGFVGVVAVLALQAQIMTRPSGLVGLVVAGLAGLALLLWRRQPSRSTGIMATTAALALFVPVLFVVVLLMPSLAGARYLFDIGFRHEPGGLSLEGGRPITGGYQRWYGTGLDESAALAAVTGAFRHPPVSNWPDADGHGVTGHLFGYRIDSRYNPVPNLCRPDEPCVVITVRRSTD